MKLKIILIIITIILLIEKNKDKEHFFGSDFGNWFASLLEAIGSTSSVKGTYVRIYDKSSTYNEHWTTSEVGGLPYVYKTLCNTVQNKL